MMRSTLSLALAAGLLSLGAPAAFAQVSNDCERQATEACANEPIVECMSRPGMFDFVGSECVGDLQAMIEMDREARAEEKSDRRKNRRNKHRQQTQDDLANQYDDDPPVRDTQDDLANQYDDDPPERDTQDDTMRGQSYGGILRSGPGMNYGKVASLQEGDPIDIIQDTGKWFDGYKWYKVRTHLGVGYHWGGIFCIDLDTQIEGILDKCNR